jgi:hypothetical protein
LLGQEETPTQLPEYPLGLISPKDHHEPSEISGYEPIMIIARIDKAISPHNQYKACSSSNWSLVKV